MFFKKKIRQGKVKRPVEFLNVMPYNNKYYRRKLKKHYWIKQIDFEYSQYCGLSGTNLQSWLDDKKRILDSIKKFARERENRNSTRRRRCISCYAHWHFNFFEYRKKHLTF